MTQLLPGQLLYVFGASILDAALLSWLALLWYRRSVNRLMRAAPTDKVVGSVEQHESSVLSWSAAAPIEPGELKLEEERPEALPHTAAFPKPGMVRLIVAYSVGAAAFAAVITGFKFWTASPPLVAVAWLVEWWTNLWPVVPTLVALLVLDRPIALRLVLLYVLGGAIAICLFTAAGQLLRGTLNTAPLTNIFWGVVSLAWTASIPFAVIVVTGWRRVRAVMPLALAGTLLFGFGSMLFRELLVRLLNVESFRAAFLSGAVFSSPETLQYALFMLVSLPVGWLAWRLLNVLAAAFANKRFSDIQLVVDCWWAVVAAEVTATSLSTTHGFLGIAGGVAAFLAYRLVVAAVLRGDRPPQRAPRLLLLRVFGYQARTESLFDRVAQTWRLQGPVQLIAGVDLAMRTADPGDVLALLDGRLAEAYVRTPQEVGERLARLDFRPDPDGRFRINEVYCHDNTWRTTLEALLDGTDKVLMDLRSFSAHNAGCRFELEQIVRRVPTDDIVLVCDKTTDLPLLHEILAAAWAAERRDRDARGSGEISVVRMERQTRSEFALLMHRLQRGTRLPIERQVTA
jgi:hypothetical protein